MKIDRFNNNHYYVGFSSEDYRNLMKLNPDNIRKVHIFMIPDDPKCVHKPSINNLCYYAWRLNYNRVNHIPVITHANIKVNIHTFGNATNKSYIEKILQSNDRRFYIDNTTESYHAYINCLNEISVDIYNRILRVIWYKNFTIYDYIKKQPIQEQRKYQKRSILFEFINYVREETIIDEIR